MRRTNPIIFILIIGLSLSHNLSADTKEILNYNLCQSCHGENLSGNLITGSPSIAGMEEWYLYRQMKNFQCGIRGVHSDDNFGQSMRLSIMSLDDSEIKTLSSFISSLDNAKLYNQIEGDLVTGEFVFQHCISCHGEYGEGDQTISAPKLTGQNDWYIYRQLINFQKGVRGQHPEDLYGKQMMEMAEMFNEEMFRDVTVYISTLDAQSIKD